MLISYKQSKERSGSLCLFYVSMQCISHHCFLKVCRVFMAIKVLTSFYTYLFLKEEEEATEGRSLSSRSTENLPC